MTITRTQLILVGIALGLLLILLAFASFRGCDQEEPILIATGIDAGPGEALIEQRLDGAIQAHQAHIEQIEEKFEEDLAAFDARQREEYERLRDGDLEAAARMLSEWNRNRRDAGR